MTSERDVMNIHIDSPAAYQASTGEIFFKWLKLVNVSLQWVLETIRGNYSSLHLIKTHEEAAMSCLLIGAWLDYTYECEVVSERKCSGEI